MHSRVQTSSRFCRKLIGDVDQHRALDNRDRLPGLSLVPLSIVNGYLRGHLIIPQQRGQTEISVPRVNHRAGFVDRGLEHQLESGVAGNGRIVAQLRDLDVYGSTELSEDGLYGLVEDLDGAGDALLFRLESGGEDPFAELELIPRDLCWINQKKTVMRGCSKHGPHSTRTPCRRGNCMQKDLSIETGRLHVMMSSLPSFHSLAKGLSLLLGILRKIEEFIPGLENGPHVLKDCLRPGTSEVQEEHAHRLASLHEFLDLGGIFVR